MPLSMQRSRGGKAAVWVLLVCLLLLAGGGFAAWYFFMRGGPSAEALALIPADADGFVTVRVADLWGSPSVQKAWAEAPDDQKQKLSEMEGKLGLTLADVERVTVVGKSVENETMWIVVSTKKPYDMDKIKGFVEQESREKLQEGTYKGKSYLHSPKGEKGSLYKLSDTTLVIAPEKGLHAAIDQQESPVKKGALADAISTASGKDHLMAAFAPPQGLLSQVPDSPPPGGPPMNLKALKQLQVGKLLGSLTEKLDLKLTLSFADAGAAGEVKQMLDSLKGLAGLAVMGIQQQNPEAAKMAQDAVQKLTIEHKEKEVLASLNVDVNVEALKPILKGAIQIGGAGGPRAAADLVRRKNNLKQIGIAMHTYLDSHQHFPRQAIFSPPPETGGPGSKPMLSWRVAILPYIEQESLYKQIRMDEPWDSEHNSQFHKQMPQIYAGPGLPADAEPGMTRIQVLTGDETMFPKPTPANPVVKVGIGSVQDGLSNTIMVVEAEKPVNWMAPEDVSFKPSPTGFLANQLGVPNEPFFLALMGDGSIREVRRTVAPMTLQNLIMRADGNPIDPDF